MSTQSQLKLAKSIPVPRFCLGTWSWGDTGTWNTSWSKEQEDQAKEAFTTSINEGVNFIDTAEVYGSGESERILGRFITDLLSDHKHSRENLVIATKYIPLPFKVFNGQLISALKKSLERLNLEYVDLYQIHGPVHWFKSRAALAEELAKAVKLGLTKSVGVSNYSKDEMIDMYNELQKRGVPLATNQVEFSLLRKLPETSGLLQAAKERDITILAYSPLGMGRLTGKYNKENMPKRKFGNADWSLIDKILAVEKEIAEKRGVSVSAVSLNYVISKGVVPLGGAKNAKQAAENAKCLGWSLDESEIERLEAVALPGKTDWLWQHG